MSLLDDFEENIELADELLMTTTKETYAARGKSFIGESNRVEGLAKFMFVIFAGMQGTGIACVILNKATYGAIMNNTPGFVAAGLISTGVLIGVLTLRAHVDKRHYRHWGEDNLERAEKAPTAEALKHRRHMCAERLAQNIKDLMPVAAEPLDFLLTDSGENALRDILPRAKTIFGTLTLGH